MNLTGHIGANASALVDGQLPPQAEERAWAHVLTCPACRQAVVDVGWTKTRLASMRSADAGSAEAPAGLIGSLYDVGAWAVTDRISRTARRRRRGGLAAVGAGSVGAAVLGLATLGGGAAPTPQGPPTTSITGPVSTPGSPTPVVSLRRGTR